MSCSMDLSIWYDECCAEAQVRVPVQVAQHKAQYPDDDPWVSFKKDIKDKSTKTTFGETHLSLNRFMNPDIQYGYEIACPTPLHLKEAQKFPAMNWSSAILCSYDPKRDGVMFEVCRERGYSYHTMIMSKFEKLISGNKITIKKI
jgi:hypothetical protein